MLYDESMDFRPAPKPNQKIKRRWPLRTVLSVLSVAGLLWLWQFIANEQTTSAQSIPSLQNAQHELQLGPPNAAGGPAVPPPNNPPDVVSGVS
jgi:hypothetical protein